MWNFLNAFVCLLSRWHSQGVEKQIHPRATEQGRQVLATSWRSANEQMSKWIWFGHFVQRDAELMQFKKHLEEGHAARSWSPAYDRIPTTRRYIPLCSTVPVWIGGAERLLKPSPQFPKLGSLAWAWWKGRTNLYLTSREKDWKGPTKNSRAASIVASGHSSKLWSSLYHHSIPPRNDLRFQLEFSFAKTNEFAAGTPSKCTPALVNLNVKKPLYTILYAIVAAWSMCIETCCSIYLVL